MTLDGDQSRVLQALLAMQRHNWEQGVAASAALDLGLDDLAEVMARDAVVHQEEDGRLAEHGDGNVVNGAAAGEVVLTVAQRSAEPELAAAARRQLHWLVSTAPRAADGTLFHMLDSRQMWADTVFMVVPYLVLCGEVELAEQQLRGHRDRLWDPVSGLYAARWDEDEQRLVQPEHWGTGNGWVAAGIARTVHLLPADHPWRSVWAPHAREVVDSCLPHRLTVADDAEHAGLFRNVVDDPGSWPEANLGQLLAYAICTGVADGWLPADGYRDVAADLLVTARRHVDRHGLVRPACGSPRFDRPGISAEAQSFFLLATAAERRLSAG